MFEGFFVLYGFIVQLDRTLRYERRNEGSNPSETTNWRSNLAGAKHSLENCWYLRVWGSTPHFSANGE